MNENLNRFFKDYLIFFIMFFFLIVSIEVLFRIIFLITIIFTFFGIISYIIKYLEKKVLKLKKEEIIINDKEKYNEIEHYNIMKEKREKKKEEIVERQKNI